MIDKELGRTYDFLMDLRETGDYGGLMSVTPDNVQYAVAKAEEFLAAIVCLCSELDGDDLGK